ncbi:MAG: nitroreductase [Pseudomonadota bacterium]
MTKSVLEAVKGRISTRDFISKPVALDDVKALIKDATWSPSGGNLQPWRIYVVSGAARDRLVDTVKQAISDNPLADESELKIYPKGLWEPFRDRRFRVGEAMYEKLGIPREDKMARLQWLVSNYSFFGAPVGLFFALDKRFDKGQWAHLGMLMQTIALLAHERGFATCMQEAWAGRAKTVSTFLSIPETEQLYCGMALGYANPEAPVNTLRSERAPIEEVTTFFEE